MTANPEHPPGTAQDRIRVVIAEDQAMVLDALATLLEMEGDITVLARVSDGRSALAAVRKLKPDVLITDIEMPAMSGLDVVEHLKDEVGTKAIIVTTFARAGYLRRALEVGAHGYLLKTRPAEELARAIRRVHRGGREIDPELAAEALGDRDPLTDREKQILRLAMDGLSTSRIASKLGLSAGTVRNYLSESIDKLDATNRIDAARIARDKGWL